MVLKITFEDVIKSAELANVQKASKTMERKGDNCLMKQILKANDVFKEAMKRANQESFC